MKKCPSFITGLLVVFLSGSSHAIPINVIVEGSVTVIYDTAGLIAEAGLKLGDSVNYDFLIDFDRAGTTTLEDGTIRTHWDSSSYYADFISGSILPSKHGGIYYGERESNHGHDEVTGSPALYVGPGDSRVFVQLYGNNIWEVGALGRVSNTSFGSNELYSQLDAQDIRITDISWLWSFATALGSGWHWLDWFGYFNLKFDPWIYHQEDGFLYPFEESKDSVVFWDAAMNAFWWTSETQYPYVYRFSDDEWLWYLEGTSGPRWFVKLSDGTWESW